MLLCCLPLQKPRNAGMALEATLTRYGQLLAGPQEEILAAHADALAEAGATPGAVLALTGGSTPVRLFDWIVETQRWQDAAWRNAVYWMTSDERHVPLDSPESNFGQARRHLLDPLGIDAERQMPWPVQVDAHSAAEVFNRNWHDHFGPLRGVDYCQLGLGGDGHTASLFPGSPLLGIDCPDFFACVEVPGKGWRLTLTPKGLHQAEVIGILVLGASKAEPLAQVFSSEPGHFPVHILEPVANKVTWYVDSDAASAL